MLLPIGTVIRRNKIDAIICGYQIKEKDNYNTLCYDIVPYPVGFENIQSVYTIPIDADIEVIFMGYVSEGYHLFRKSKEKLNELMSQYTVDEWNVIFDDVLEELDRLQEER